MIKIVQEEFNFSQSHEGYIQMISLKGIVITSLCNLFSLFNVSAFSIGFLWKIFLGFWQGGAVLGCFELKFNIAPPFCSCFGRFR